MSQWENQVGDLLRSMCRPAGAGVSDTQHHRKVNGKHHTGNGPCIETKPTVKLHEVLSLEIRCSGWRILLLKWFSIVFTRAIQVGKVSTGADESVQNFSHYQVSFSVLQR